MPRQWALFGVVFTLLINAAALLWAADGTCAKEAFVTVGGRYKASPATLSDGDYEVAHLDANGNLKVSVAAQVAGSKIAVTGLDAGSVARDLPVAVAGNTATTTCVTFGGKDGAGNEQIAAIETSTNALQVTQGLNLLLDTDSFSGEVTSNGTSYVVIAAGQAAKSCYVGEVVFTNASSSTPHKVTVADTNTGTVIWAANVGPSGSSSMAGFYKTSGGGGLKFKIDSGGTGTDVTATSSLVFK